MNMLVIREYILVFLMKFSILGFRNCSPTSLKESEFEQNITLSASNFVELLDLLELIG